MRIWTPVPVGAVVVLVLLEVVEVFVVVVEVFMVVVGVVSVVTLRVVVVVVVVFVVVAAPKPSMKYFTKQDILATYQTLGRIGWREGSNSFK